MIGSGLMDRLIPAARAHEKWFVDAASAMPPQPSFYIAWNPWTVGAVIAIATAVVGGFFADRWFERSPLHARLEGWARPFRDIAAVALSASVGILLLWSAAGNTLLADNFRLAPGIAGTMIRITEAAFGAAFLVGLYMPASAVALLILYCMTFLLFPWPDPLEYVHLPAIALFLLAFARGRYSLDWFLGKSIVTTARERKQAYLLLRVVMGIGLLILAAEKWAEPGLHLRLIEAYSAWNPYAILTLFGYAEWLSEEQYVFLLSLAETISAAFILFGFVTRVTAAFLIFLFLASMAFLGPFELFGHLPIIGALFVLCVFGDRYHKAERPAPAVEKTA